MLLRIAAILAAVAVTVTGWAGSPHRHRTVTVNPRVVPYRHPYVSPIYVHPYRLGYRDVYVWWWAAQPTVTVPPPRAGSYLDRQDRVRRERDERLLKAAQEKEDFYASPPTR